MSNESLFTRCLITSIVLVVSAAFLPIMLLLKLAEGVYVALRITKESLTQVWHGEKHPWLR